MTDAALNAAAALICETGDTQCDDSRFIAAAVVRAYLDALDPAEVPFVAGRGTPVPSARDVAAVIKAVRP